MSFVEEVNKIRDGVLSKPEYSVPLKELNERVEEYKAQKVVEEKSNQKEDQELTI